MIGMPVSSKALMRLTFTFSNSVLFNALYISTLGKSGGLDG